MNKERRIIVEEVIASHIAAIQNKAAAQNQLRTQPRFLEDSHAQNNILINKTVEKLKAESAELLPYIKRLKTLIPDITEQDAVVAIYLLAAHTLRNWEAFFLLSQNGFNSPAANQIRMIKEGIAQIELITLEAMKGDNKNANKWFQGDIISHSASRKTMSDYMAANVGELSINIDDIKATQSTIYAIESQASHNGYGSILESVSPFTGDYDYDGYTQHHFTLDHLNYALGSMDSMVIALKMVYKNFFPNDPAYERLDMILRKYRPEIYNQ